MDASPGNGLRLIGSHGIYESSTINGVTRIFILGLYFRLIPSEEQSTRYGYSVHKYFF